MGLIGILSTTSLKSHQQFALTQRFLSSRLFRHVLSDYPAQSHNFFNLDFVIPLLLYCIFCQIPLCLASKEKGEFNPGYNFLPIGSIKTWRLSEWTVNVYCRFPLVTNSKKMIYGNFSCFFLVDYLSKLSKDKDSGKSEQSGSRQASPIQRCHSDW